MSSKTTVDDLSKLLKKFDEDVLKTMMEATKMDYKKDVNEMSDDLIDWAYEQGIKKFVEKLDAPTLKSSMKEAAVEVPDDLTALTSLGEKFLDSVEMDANGPEGFLSKMKMATLKKFAQILNFETDAANEKQFAEDIADQFLLDGTILILSFLSEDQLKQTCEILKLKVKAKSTKANCTDLILGQVFSGILPDEEEEEEPKKKEKKSTKEKKEKKEKKSTKEKKEKKEKKVDGRKELKAKREEQNEQIKANRPKLEECKDFDDIFQNYWSEELKEFCKTNGINSQGTKKILIKRILDFNEDPENKGYTVKKRKRKASSSGKNKKKKPTKKDEEETNGTEESNGKESEEVETKDE